MPGRGRARRLPCGRRCSRPRRGYSALPAPRTRRCRLARTSPIATARTTYSTMSSITATDSTMREKRVPSRPTSCMIREITGMLVTATAIPNTRVSAALLPAVPMKLLTPSTATRPSPAANGSTRPKDAISPTVPHRVALKQPAHLRAGGEHEQQQAQLVDRPQRGRRRAARREDPVLDAREGRAKGRGPEQDAAYNLADRARLPEPREQGTHAVRGQQEDSQRDQQPGKINVCEGHTSSTWGSFPRGRCSDISTVKRTCVSMSPKDSGPTRNGHRAGTTSYEGPSAAVRTWHRHTLTARQLA